MTYFSGEGGIILKKQSGRLKLSEGKPHRKHMPSLDFIHTSSIQRNPGTTAIVRVIRIRSDVLAVIL